LAESAASYFAAAPLEDIGQRLAARLEDCLTAPSVRGDQWRQAYESYYGFDVGGGSTSSISRGGDVGEQVLLRINHARRAASALLSILLGPRFAWRAQAPNSDPRSRSALIITANLLEHVWKTKRLNKYTAKWAEQAILMAESFLFPEWDTGSGPVIGPNEDESGLLRAGDLKFHTLLPWDVSTDECWKSYEDAPYVFGRLLKNKWDLAELCPVDVMGEPAREKICNASNDRRVRDYSYSRMRGLSDDVVPVFYFFHKPTPALPFGRQTIFLHAECVLRDRHLVDTYPAGIPLHRFAIGEQFDTPHGYSPWWDALAIQELIDGVESACATNLLTYGSQSIAVMDGTQSDPTHAFGNRVFKYPRDGRAPEPIQLATLPPLVLPYLADKAKTINAMVGLNDVFMGSPDTAQMNAQAFALLASMAVQANSPAQQNLITQLGELGTGVVATYRKNVVEARQIPVVGKHNKHLFSTLQFTGADLEPIDGVIVEVGNALEQTPAGRFQLANTFREWGFLQTPEQAEQVLETGKLEPATQASRDALMLIAHENEELREGRNPICHTYHDHPQHYREHASLMSDPEALKRPEVVMLVQSHCDSHYRELFGFPDELPVQADPQYLVRVRMMLGQDPGPLMMAPPMPVGPEAGMPGGGAPETAGLVPPGAETPPTAPMPSAPPNPLTGQPFDVGGGMAPTGALS
jgi:hypothetical protein